MTVEVSEVRQHVAGMIDAALAASGWVESPVVYDAFGTGVSGERAHESYAVGCPSTDYYVPDAPKPRQKEAVGQLVQTDVGIRMLYEIGSGKQVADYDAALDAEREVLNAISAAPRAPGLHLVLSRIPTVRTVEDGWFSAELHITATHRIALS